VALNTIKQTNKQTRYSSYWRSSSYPPTWNGFYIISFTKGVN